MIGPAKPSKTDKPNKQNNLNKRSKSVKLNTPQPVLTSGQLRFFRSLTGKILAVLLSLIAVCAVSFALVSYAEIQRSMTSQMKSDGTTLVANIKREIVKDELLNLEELQQVFQTIKQDSGGNIVYVSLADTGGQVIVSDSSLRTEGEAGAADAVSSASTANTGSDLSAVVERQETQGRILETAGGEKVYNISTDFTYSPELSGALNVGLSLKSMYGQIREAQLETLVVSLIIFVLAAGIGLVLARKMIRPITMMSERIKGFAEGDFTGELIHNGKDEIGTMAADLTHMRQTLGGIVETIQKNADQVFASSRKLTAMIDETSFAAGEVSKAADELAAGSGGLAANSQAGLDRLNRLAAEIMALTERADRMKASIEQTREANHTSMNSMEQLQRAIRENAEITVKIEEQVNALSAKSEAITEVAAVIKAVAGQTNMLALNAMIESARAGEQGRGFAVVAEQIRVLSEQTRGSVQGIEDMVREVGAAVADAKNYMQQGAEAIDRTSAASLETGQAFNMIDRTVQQITQEIEVLVSGIAQVNEDKNEVIGTIESMSSIAQESTASTEEISASTQQQLANMEQVSASARGLESIADQLGKSVERFKF